jgi:membrane protein
MKALDDDNITEPKIGDAKRSGHIFRRWAQRWRNYWGRREREYLAHPIGRRRDVWPLVAYWTYVTATRKDILSKASALAYTLVFSLVPLLTTVFAFLTAFPGLESERNRFYELLSGYLLPAVVRDAQARLAEMSERAAAAGALSSLLFFAVVLLLFQTAEMAFNQIWETGTARRWGERLRAIAYFLVLGAIGASLFVVARNQMAAYAGELSLRTDAAWSASVYRWAYGVAGLLVAWVLFTAAIRILPHVRVTWAAATAGGIFAGTVWSLLKEGFTWYIENWANYNNIYGALGAVPVFFLWVYLSFLVLLAGACLAFSAQNLRELIVAERAAKDGAPLAYYTALVGRELARAFERGEEPLGRRGLAARLRMAPYFVAESLERLVKMGIAVSLSRQGEARYVLARPAHAISLWDIVGGMSEETLRLPREFFPEEKGIPAAKSGAPLVQTFDSGHSLLRAHFERVTLADLLANQEKKSA